MFKHYTELDEKIEVNEVGSERKQLRSARKEPKQYRKLFENFLAIIWTDKQIIFLIVFPIGCVKGVILIFLFLFLTILIVCNQWNTFPIFHDVFIILFTSITCVRNNILRKLKILAFNLIQKRNQCTCICRIWKHIISKCVLPFSRKLHIITRLQLAIPHMIVFHSHKLSVMIRLRVTVALSEDFHVLLIFLFACHKVFESFALLFGSLRAERSCLRSLPTSFASIFSSNFFTLSFRFST